MAIHDDFSGSYYKESKVVANTVPPPSRPPVSLSRKPILYGFNAGAVIAYIRPTETVINIEKMKSGGAWLTSDEIITEDENGNIHAHHIYSPDGFDVIVNRSDLYELKTR